MLSRGGAQTIPLHLQRPVAAGWAFLIFCFRATGPYPVGFSGVSAGAPWGELLGAASVALSLVQRAAPPPPPARLMGLWYRPSGLHLRAVWLPPILL